MNKHTALSAIKRGAKRANVAVVDIRVEGDHIKMLLHADNDRAAQVGMLYSFKHYSEKEIELYTMRFAKHWCLGEPYTWGGWGDSIR